MNDWKLFWYTINTDKKLFMDEYFNGYPDSFEKALLKLLIAEEFKTWLKDSRR